jgi:hypothetical protein
MKRNTVGGADFVRYIHIGLHKSQARLILITTDELDPNHVRVMRINDTVQFRIIGD